MVVQFPGEIFEWCSAAEAETTLVELLLDLVEALLAEVGDVEQIVLGLGEQLTDGVDLSPLEAVPRALRQIELLNGEIELGRRVRRHRGVAELKATGFGRHLGDEIDQ